MDFAPLRAAAQAAVPPDAWAFFQGTADGRADSERDARAWDQWDLVPRILTGLTTIDTSVELGGARFASPVTIAATAGHGACHDEGECLTIAAAANAGMLMTYSHNASIAVERFAASATSPWWAQIYVQRDRAVTADYLARCADAGAAAFVLTLDVPGTLADASFRRAPLVGPVAVRGNVGPTGGGAGAAVESCFTPDDVAAIVESSGLPVWAKGVMTPEDAIRALDAGAAGVVVSNHGRRQLSGVAPVADVLGGIADAVAGRAPVLVDGGIRSGADVVRALALGAAAVGIGRPVLWALAAGGQAQLEAVLQALNEEVAAAMAGLGAGRVADVMPGMVRRAGV
ncbi:alpha-hydroxy acid oxidase [Amnibacterium sp.]|uniref:alpha-hydroxy acid oxidase n=1 Tax=Amnibacterium sp. TaxID=1872496 RepID=UPI002608C8D9|nr:alpha-hydroxy acid oxidase [Amnibacterium sp.]